MNSHDVAEQQAQVEAFSRRHRTGLVTLLFSDIVGSTQLKQSLGDQPGVALIQRHHALVRALLGTFPDAEELGVAGDSFFLAFAKPSEAVKFALTLQARLPRMAKEMAAPVCDRIGIHLGEVLIEEGTTHGPRRLYGIQVDTCARVMALAGANQILMTRLAFDSARQVLRGAEVAGLGDLRWFNHGPYRLKGVEEPVEICEVRVGEGGPVTPPAGTEKAQRVAADGDLVLGWRPAVNQVVPGTQWKLEAKLGEGGFGEVWLGRHRRLKERRVFKFCFRADRVRALKREMTLFRVLKERVGDHPQIVRLLEVNLEQPPFYLEEEYLSGRDLRTWCESQGGIPATTMRERLEIVAQAAEGLAAAHEAGIIHRDVKPGNILVRGRGSVAEDAPASTPPSAAGQPPLNAKLTDFGIGQVVSSEYLVGVTAAGFTGTITRHTLASRTGTHAFMAPEVLMGQPASVQSDIYSLGIVLFQLLVGDFTRPVTMDWAEEISDPLLQEVLKRCFAGKPEDRFASAAELAKHLRSWLERPVAQEVAPQEPFDREVARQVSIAVLPFVNMSADPENDFLSDGITEDLIAALSRVPGLRVPARTSTFAFKGQPQDIRAIGHRLKVQSVLEGSVRKAGHRLRVTTQLISVADGFHIWSERYDREMADVFAIQDDITLAIVEALKIRLATEPAFHPVKRYTPRPDTYQLYLKSRFCTAKLTQDGLTKAMRFLDQALSQEPNYPLLYVNQSRSYFALASLGFLRPREGMPKSQAAASRALELDHSLAEAHTQLALTRFSYDWDWTGAEREFRQALALDPNSAETRHQYGLFLWAMTRHQEALAEAKAAVDLDPLSLQINTDFAVPLISLRRHAEAIEHADRLISLEPNFWGGYRIRALAKAACGQTRGAIPDLEKAVELGGGPFVLGHLGSAFARVGRIADAQRVLAQLDQLGHQRYVPAFCWIAIYAALGNHEQLVTSWDRAIAERDPFLPAFKAITQTWLVDHPDLPALLQRIGL